MTSPIPDNTFDAVVWDYDGTLVDTRIADERAVADLIGRDPHAIAGAEVFWATEGEPIYSRLERAWPGRAQEILSLFDRRVRPRVFDGVDEVVEEIARRGLVQAVVSSRRVEPLEWGLEATGLRRHFTSVIGLESVSAPKPDPEGLRLALTRAAVPATRAVYVGDREVDVDAGRAAGVTVWRALWGLGSNGAAPRSPIELGHPDEVLQRIDGLSRRAG